MLVAQPLSAAGNGSAAQIGPLPPATLSPGKPSGVRPAQSGDLIPIYGSVLLFGALLAATIGVNGSSAPPNAPTSSTNFCCG